MVEPNDPSESIADAQARARVDAKRKLAADEAEAAVIIDEAMKQMVLLANDKSGRRLRRFLEDHRTGNPRIDDTVKLFIEATLNPPTEDRGDGRGDGGRGY